MTGVASGTIARTVLAAALLATGACKKSSDALLLIRVEGTLSDVRSLKVIVTPVGDGGAASPVVPLSASYPWPGPDGAALTQSGLTVGTIVPGDVGRVVVTVQAFTSASSTAVETGTSREVTPAAGATTDVLVVLGADGGGGDGGATDAPTSSAGSTGHDGGSGTGGGAAGAGGSAGGGGGGAGTAGAAGARGTDCPIEGEMSCFNQQPLQCVNGYRVNQGPACSAPTTCYTGMCSCMGTICGTECLNVQTSAHHCGTCEHDCLYGMCASGLCKGAGIYGGAATQLAVTASFLYFIADLGVYRTALDGTGFTNFAEVAAVGLAVVGGNVYVATATSANENNYPNRVMKFPESGGNPTTIAMEQHGAISIAVRDGMVYWAAADDQLLMKATQAGAGLTTIATLNDRATEIAADATNIYWTSVGLTTNSGTVKQVSVNNNNAGTPLTLASGLVLPGGLALDSTSVYFLDHSQTGSLTKVPIGGGSPVPLVMGEEFATALVLDGTTLYWGNISGFEKISTTGGKSTISRNALPSPGALAIGTDTIYSANAGFVYRIPKF